MVSIFSANTRLTSLAQPYVSETQKWLGLRTSDSEQQQLFRKQ